MLSNLHKLIGETEAKWLNPLFNQCKEQFARIHLPSHDEIHHMRVWNYAKMLLPHVQKQHIPFSETDIERLIIAVFFHDQGMSESLSKEHGQISRRICKTFFQTSTLAAPTGFDSVLQAIENHDQKDYRGVNNTNTSFDVQKILNIADDLDALGITGAYRYLEIYLLRHMAVNAIPEAVLNNMEGRFKHFSETFASNHALLKVQGHRYAHARNFFKDLNLQLKLIEYQPDLYIGPLGVINYIKNEVIGNKKSLQEVCKMATSENQDFYVSHFFERLKKEIAC